MRLHDRYLLRELLTPLAFCLGGFLIFWLAIFFTTQSDDIRDAKLHFGDTLELCLANLPEFLVQLLPILLLLALLYALTHHAKAHELTALRAAGVSLWRLCAPYFAVGLAATGIYFLLNEIAVPRANAWAEEIKHRYVKTTKVVASKKTKFTNVDGYHFTPARRQWKFSEFDGVKGEMTVPTVSWPQPDGSLRILQADAAVFTNDTWTFFNARILTQTNAAKIPTPLLSRPRLEMREFPESPAKILADLQFREKQSWAGTRSADLPLTEINALFRNNPDMGAEAKHRLKTKFYGRLAEPWKCVVVVLMAIPFGAQSGRRNLFYGVAGSIFICFAYFVLQSVSLAFGVGGHLPSWLAAWLPNIIFATIGIFLTWRVR